MWSIDQCSPTGIIDVRIFNVSFLSTCQEVRHGGTRDLWLRDYCHQKERYTLIEHQPCSKLLLMMRNPQVIGFLLIKNIFLDTYFLRSIKFSSSS